MLHSDDCVYLNSEFKICQNEKKKMNQGNDRCFLLIMKKGNLNCFCRYFTCAECYKIREPTENTMKA
jgi:hypothetical protein